MSQLKANAQQTRQHILRWQKTPTSFSAQRAETFNHFPPPGQRGRSNFVVQTPNIVCNLRSDGQLTVNSSKPQAVSCRRPFAWPFVMIRSHRPLMLQQFLVKYPSSRIDNIYPIKSAAAFGRLRLQAPQMGAVSDATIFQTQFAVVKHINTCSSLIASVVTIAQTLEPRLILYLPAANHNDAHSLL